MVPQWLCTFVRNLLMDWLDVSSDTLTLGLWKGQLAVENVQLKLQPLDTLRTPIVVRKVHVGKLNLTVPWRSLLHDSITALLEDVVVVAEMADSVPFDTDFNNAAVRKALIRKLEQAIALSTTASADRTWLSWVTRTRLYRALTERAIEALVRSVQVNVHRLHVRVEDPCSQPGSLVAAGIMIQQLALGSTEEWTMYQHLGSSTAVGKQLDVTKLSAYFCTASGYSWVSKQMDEVLADHSQWANGPLPAEIAGSLMLFPINANLQLRFDLAEIQTAIPWLHVILGLDNVTLSLDERQYVGIARLAAYLVRVQEQSDASDGADQAAARTGAELWGIARNRTIDKFRRGSIPWTWQSVRQFSSLRREYVNSVIELKENRFNNADILRRHIRILEHRMEIKDICFLRAIASYHPSAPKHLPLRSFIPNKPVKYLFLLAKSFVTLEPFNGASFWLEQQTQSSVEALEEGIFTKIFESSAPKQQSSIAFTVKSPQVALVIRSSLPHVIPSKGKECCPVNPAIDPASYAVHPNRHNSFTSGRTSYASVQSSVMHSSSHLAKPICELRLIGLDVFAQQTGKTSNATINVISLNLLDRQNPKSLFPIAVGPNEAYESEQSQTPPQQQQQPVKRRSSEPKHMLRVQISHDVAPLRTVFSVSAAVTPVKAYWKDELLQSILHFFIDFLPADAVATFNAPTKAQYNNSIPWQYKPRLVCDINAVVTNAIVIFPSSVLISAGPCIKVDLGRVNVDCTVARRKAELGLSSPLFDTYRITLFKPQIYFSKNPKDRGVPMSEQNLDGQPLILPLIITHCHEHESLAYPAVSLGLEVPPIHFVMTDATIHMFTAQLTSMLVTMRLIFWSNTPPAPELSTKHAAEMAFLSSPKAQKFVKPNRNPFRSRSHRSSDAKEEPQCGQWKSAANYTLLQTNINFELVTLKVSQQNYQASRKGYLGMIFVEDMRLAVASRHYDIALDLSLHSATVTDALHKLPILRMEAAPEGDASGKRVLTKKGEPCAMLFLYNEVLRELPEFTTKYSFVDQIVHFEFSQSSLIFDARLLPIFYDVYISLSFADRDCVRAAFAAVEDKDVDNEHLDLTFRERLQCDLLLTLSEPAGQNFPKLGYVLSNEFYFQDTKVNVVRGDDVFLDCYLTPSDIRILSTDLATLFDFNVGAIKVLQRIEQQAGSPPTMATIVRSQKDHTASAVLAHYPKEYALYAGYDSSIGLTLEPLELDFSPRQLVDLASIFRGFQDVSPAVVWGAKVAIQTLRTTGIVNPDTFILWNVNLALPAVHLRPTVSSPEVFDISLGSLSIKSDLIDESHVDQMTLKIENVNVVTKSLNLADQLETDAFLLPYGLELDIVRNIDVYDFVMPDMQVILHDNGVQVEFSDKQINLLIKMLEPLQLSPTATSEQPLSSCVPSDLHSAGSQSSLSSSPSTFDSLDLMPTLDDELAQESGVLSVSSTSEDSSDSMARLPSPWERYAREDDPLSVVLRRARLHIADYDRKLSRKYDERMIKMRQEFASKAGVNVPSWKLLQHAYLFREQANNVTWSVIDWSVRPGPIRISLVDEYAGVKMKQKGRTWSSDTLSSSEDMDSHSIVSQDRLESTSRRLHLGELAINNMAFVGFLRSDASLSFEFTIEKCSARDVRNNKTTAVADKNRPDVITASNLSLRVGMSADRYQSFSLAMSDAHLGVQFDYWIEMADVILVPFAHKLEAWSQPSRRHSGYASSPPTLPPRTASVMLDSVASQSVLMLCQVQIDLANVSLLLCTGTLENGSGMRLSCDRICILKDGPNLKGSTRGFTIRACTMSSVRPVERCCFALLEPTEASIDLTFGSALSDEVSTRTRANGTVRVQPLDLHVTVHDVLIVSALIESFHTALSNSVFLHPELQPNARRLMSLTLMDQLQPISLLKHKLACTFSSQYQSFADVGLDAARAVNTIVDRVVFQIDGIHLLLSQDDGSVVLPFISTRLSAGEAVIEGTPNELRMKLMINVGVNFFNSHRSLWDSLVQYWPVHIEASTTRGPVAHRTISFRSKDRLDMSVSTDFVHSVLSILKRWDRLNKTATARGPREEHLPFLFVNETGYEIVCWSESQPMNRRIVPANTQTRWSPTIRLPSETDNVFTEIRIGVKLHLMPEIAEAFVALNKCGTHTAWLRLENKRELAGRLACDVVWRGGTKVVTLRSATQVHNGTDVPFIVGMTNRHGSLLEWRVDPLTTYNVPIGYSLKTDMRFKPALDRFRRHAKPSTTETSTKLPTVPSALNKYEQSIVSSFVSGASSVTNVPTPQQYATDSSSLLARSTSSFSCSSRNDESDQNDDEVDELMDDLDDAASSHATASTCSSYVAPLAWDATGKDVPNPFLVPEVVVSTDATASTGAATNLPNQSSTCGSTETSWLYSSETFACEFRHSNSVVMTCHPDATSAGFFEGSMPLSQATSSRQHRASIVDDLSRTFVFVVSGVLEDRQHGTLVVRILAPFTVQNVLPVPMTITVSDRSGSTLANAIVSSGQSGYIYADPSKGDPSLRVFLPSLMYESSSPMLLRHDEETIALMHTNGQSEQLSLRLQCVRDAITPSCRQISVYAQYLFINKTGLDLSIRIHSGFALDKDSMPRTVVADEVSGLCFERCLIAGEHGHTSESAPITLYSAARFTPFGSRLTLRGPDTMWCRPFSFNTVGMKSEVHLNPIQGMGGYQIGCNVEFGSGVFAKTRIVTLSPRFIVVNDSPLHFELAHVRTVDVEAPPASPTPSQAPPAPSSFSAHKQDGHHRKLSKKDKLKLFFHSADDNNDDHSSFRRQGPPDPPLQERFYGAASDTDVDSVHGPASASASSAGSTRSSVLKPSPSDTTTATINAFISQMVEPVSNPHLYSPGDRKALHLNLANAASSAPLIAVRQHGHTHWSSAFDPTVIGTTYLKIASLGRKAHQPNEAPILVRVDVSLQDSALCVHIVRHLDPPPYRIDNFTNVPIVFEQGIYGRLHHHRHGRTVEPSQGMPFLWEDPLCKDHTIRVVIQNETREIDLRSIGDIAPVQIGSTAGQHPQEDPDQQRQQEQHHHHRYHGPYHYYHKYRRNGAHRSGSSSAAAVAPEQQQQQQPPTAAAAAPAAAAPAEQPPLIMFQLAAEGNITVLRIYRAKSPGHTLSSVAVAPHQVTPSPSSAQPVRSNSVTSVKRKLLGNLRRHKKSNGSSNNNNHTDVVMANVPSSSGSWSIHMDLKGLGLSLLDQQPMELVYVTLQQWEMSLKITDVDSKLSASLQAFQVDNQVPNSLFPMVIYQTRIKTRPSLFEIMKDEDSITAGCIPAAVRRGDLLASKGDSLPFLKLNFRVIHKKSIGILVFEYFSVLMQEVTVELTESFMVRMDRYVDELVTGWVQLEDRIGDMRNALPDVVPPPTPNQVNHVQKIYFGLFELSPIQLNLTILRAHDDTSSIGVSFLQQQQPTSGTASSSSASSSAAATTTLLGTPQRFGTGGLAAAYAVPDRSLNAFNVLFNVLAMTWGNINQAHLRLNALEASKLFADEKTLLDVVRRHYVRQGIYQLYKLVGAADAIGSPVNLFGSLAQGVEDFFYEPIYGLLRGPSDFAMGLTVGMASLLKSVGVGMLDTTSKITSSLGRGLAEATLDRNYQMMRVANLSEGARANMLTGFKSGFKAVELGMTSAIGGLFTKAHEGYQIARSTGANPVAGFAKGAGRGVVGFATKPIVGLMDGAAILAQSVRNQLFTRSYTDDIVPVRLPRHIGIDGAVRPYTALSAFGALRLRMLQQKAHRRFRRKKYLLNTIDPLHLHNHHGHQHQHPQRTSISRSSSSSNEQYDAQQQLQGESTATATAANAAADWPSLSPTAADHWHDVEPLSSEDEDNDSLSAPNSDHEDHDEHEHRQLSSDKAHRYENDGNSSSSSSSSSSEQDEEVYQNHFYFPNEGNILVISNKNLTLLRQSTNSQLWLIPLALLRSVRGFDEMLDLIVSAGSANEDDEGHRVFEPTPTTAPTATTLSSDRQRIDVVEAAPSRHHPVRRLFCRHRKVRNVRVLCNDSLTRERAETAIKDALKRYNEEAAVIADVVQGSEIARTLLF